MSRNFTLNDLPSSEKPRERLQKYGPEYLSAQELLALILGRGINGESVMMTSQRLLSKFGSLNNILSASLEDLCQIRGIGVAKATQLMACFQISQRLNQNTPDIQSVYFPEDLAPTLIQKIGKLTKEHFIMVSLNTRNKIVSTDTISIGTLNSSIVHPRETFENAIRHHAAKIIISHNHPSHDPSPSEADLTTTDQLKAAGHILGIELSDHIIVTREKYFSFKEQGLL